MGCASPECLLYSMRLEDVNDRMDFHTVIYRKQSNRHVPRFMAIAVCAPISP